MEPGHEDDYQFEYVYAYALIASGKPDQDAEDGKARQGEELRRGMAAGRLSRFYRGEMKIALEDTECSGGVESEAAGPVHNRGSGALWTRRYRCGCALEGTLAEDSDDFMANLYLGTIRLNQRDLEDAGPLLELALQLQRITLARLEMAKLNDLKGRLAEAVVILEDFEKPIRAG